MYTLIIKAPYQFDKFEIYNKIPQLSIFDQNYFFGKI